MSDGNPHIIETEDLVISAVTNELPRCTLSACFAGDFADELLLLHDCILVHTRQSSQARPRTFLFSDSTRLIRHATLYQHNTFPAPSERDTRQITRSHPTKAYYFSVSPNPEPDRGRGRPLIDADLVAVSIDGKGVAWLNGVFTGDPALVTEAELSATLQTKTALRYRGPVVTAGSSTPVEAAAAMVSVSPGRAVITQAPDTVWALTDDPEQHLDSDVPSTE